MKVLVAGGAGYFGSLLVEALHAQGMHCRVLDLNAVNPLPDGVEQICGDVRDDTTVAQAVDGVDVVVNSIAMVPLAKNRHLFQSVNQGGTRILLDASRKQQVRKFVQVSSSAVYGMPQELPVTEATRRLPLDPYGISKNQAEDHCRQAVCDGLDVTILRPRTLLGAGRLGIFQLLFEWVRRGRRIPVLAGPESPYQFLHAADLADAVARSLGQPGPAEYNLGAGVYASIQEGLEALCAQAGTGASVVRLPRRPVEWGMRAAHAIGISPLAPYHALMYGHAMYFDCSLAARELGWRPLWSNEGMLVQSYEHYLQTADSQDAVADGSLHQQPVKSVLLEAFSRSLAWLPNSER